jgi:hypothetical protein
MVSAEGVAELAASLGTVAGLVRVDAEIASLNRRLIDSRQAFSREQLAQMQCALGVLSTAILSMDRAARDLLIAAGAGAVNCVG